MEKYWHVIKQAYIKSLTFRAEVILWLFLDTVPLLVLVFVWLSMYQQRTTLAGYSLAAILQYYFLVSIINGISSTHFEAWRVQEIRDGKIDYFLIRPLSYIKELLFRDVGGKLFYLSISLPFFVALFLLLSTVHHLELPTFALGPLLLFMAMIVTTYTIEFSIAALIVLAGFWFEYSEGMEHFKWIVVTVFSGWMIPVVMMPKWLSTVVNTLPFKYMYAVPIGVIQGTYQFSLTDVLYLGGFISFLLIAMQLLWKKAQYRYSSQGG